MPAVRTDKPSHRSSPLSHTETVIPASLPPAFGITELYDWSTPLVNPGSSFGASSSGGSSVKCWAYEQQALWSSAGQNTNKQLFPTELLSAPLPESESSKSVVSSVHSTRPIKKSLAPELQLPTPQASPTRMTAKLRVSRKPQAVVDITSDPGDSSIDSVCPQKRGFDESESEPERRSRGSRDRKRRLILSEPDDTPEERVPESSSSTNPRISTPVQELSGALRIEPRTEPSIAPGGTLDQELGVVSGVESSVGSSKASAASNSVEDTTDGSSAERDSASDSDASESSAVDEDELEEEEEEEEVTYSRRSIYIDDAAEEVRAKGIKSKEKPVATARASIGDDRWEGGDKGPIKFRKDPKGENVGSKPGTWTYAGDGIKRHPADQRAVGDIHFSPGYSGSEGCDYWICVDDGGLKWRRCAEGQPHPTLRNYVLKPRDKKLPPCWVLVQSYRAHNSRKR